MESKDIFYFRHDTATRQDQAVQKLIAKFGSDGYGLFWAMLETLYKNNGIIQNDMEDLDIIRTQVYSKLDISDFIRYCLKVSIFIEKDGVLSNKRVTDFLNGKKSISEKNSESGKKAMEKRWGAKEKDFSEHKEQVIIDDSAPLQKDPKTGKKIW